MNDKVEDTKETQDIASLNKYEQVVISSRESRRLNEAVRSTNKELRRRVVDVAWERLHGGKINYTYGEVPIVEEDFEFPELQEGDETPEALIAPDLLADVLSAPIVESNPKSEVEPVVEAEPEPEPEADPEPELTATDEDELPSFDEAQAGDEESSEEPLEEGLSS